MATAKKTVTKTATKNVKAEMPATKVASKVKSAMAGKPVANTKPSAEPVSSKTKKVDAPTGNPAKKAVAIKATAEKTTILTKTNDKSKSTTKAPAKAVATPAKKAPATVAAKASATVATKAPAKSAAKPVAKEVPSKAAGAKTAVSKVAASKAAVVKPSAKTPVPVGATVKKAPAKKAVTAKVIAEKAVKTVAPIKKESAAPAVKREPKKPARPKKGTKTLTKSTAQLMPGRTAPKPSPAPAAFIGREEKKTNIIVAHRRLESKNINADDSGKTMINYKPEFTRSILGNKQEDTTGPVYRYSDEELNEFRELIQSRLEKARKELTYQQGLITRKDEAGTEDTENRYMNMEDGSGAMEREQLAQLASRQIQFINHLEKALIRIENKTYGICRVSGNLIDKNRLRAVPHATLSIDAKNQMNKK